MKEGKKERRLLLTFRANKGGEGKRRGRAHKQRERERERGSSSHLVCGPLIRGRRGGDLVTFPPRLGCSRWRQRVRGGAKEEGKKGRGVSGGEGIPLCGHHCTWLRRARRRKEKGKRRRGRAHKREEKPLKGRRREGKRREENKKTKRKETARLDLEARPNTDYIFILGNLLLLLLLDLHLVINLHRSKGSARTSGGRTQEARR